MKLIYAQMLSGDPLSMHGPVEKTARTS